MLAIEQMQSALNFPQARAGESTTENELEHMSSPLRMTALTCPFCRQRLALEKEDIRSRIALARRLVKNHAETIQVQG